ncbi:MAG: flavodoxin family protein [Candidatus Coatesbacteria bacterium]|nr:flavodoxin family protein [Candidatus Coatesbacteria bacterium]
MRVVAFNGSPRKDGNTTLLINYVFEELKKEGIETEMVSLAGKPLRGCIACYKCYENQDKRCVISGDELNRYIEKMIEADGIILASPVYFTDVTSEMKALIDRAGFVTRGNGSLLKRKIGAAIVAVRRGGQLHTFDTLNHFFLISQMIVPGSTYWNFGIGRNIGEVHQDEEGVKTMVALGQNMAWLLKKING